MASRASEPRQKFAAARAFYLTILVISIFAAWSFVASGKLLGKGGEGLQLQKREQLPFGHVGLTHSDEEVGMARD